MSYKIVYLGRDGVPNSWHVTVRIKGKKAVLSNVTYRQTQSFIKAHGFTV